MIQRTRKDSNLQPSDSKCDKGGRGARNRAYGAEFSDMRQPPTRVRAR